MNVLQILPALDIGGVERGTVDFARYLTLNGHKSVVVSGGGKLVRRLDEVGARHYQLPVGRKPLSLCSVVLRRESRYGQKRILKAICPFLPLCLVVVISLGFVCKVTA